MLVLYRKRTIKNVDLSIKSEPVTNENLLNNKIILSEIKDKLDE